jgi:hypothetical protein
MFCCVYLNLAAVGVESRPIWRRPLPERPLPKLPDGCHWSTNVIGTLTPICDGSNPTPDNPPPSPAALTSPCLFVFGDSFVDNGNLPKDPQQPNQITRQWNVPYGGSYGKDDGSPAEQYNPTGRFSNYLVQSDFIGTYTFDLCMCVA